MDIQPIVVGIREFKSHLSEYLRKARKGQVIVITDRGEPVGRVVPAGGSPEPDLLSLREAGLVSWNGRRLRRRRPVTRARGRRTVSDQLIDDRG